MAENEEQILTKEGKRQLFKRASILLISPSTSA